MDVILQWIAGRPAALDGFIGGIFSSIIVVWVYDHWMIVKRAGTKEDKKTD
jgi:hypothetical protein